MLFEITCARCGEGGQFRHPSHMRHGRMYCSATCYHTAQRAPAVACRACGGEITTRPYIRKFCSQACYATMRVKRAARSKPGKPPYRGPQGPRTCLYCGVGLAGRQTFYCSRRCQGLETARPREQEPQLKLEFQDGG